MEQRTETTHIINFLFALRVWVLLAISRYNFKIINGVGGKHEWGKFKHRCRGRVEGLLRMTRFCYKGYFLYIVLWIGAFCSYMTTMKKGSKTANPQIDLLLPQFENVNVWKWASYLRDVNFKILLDALFPPKLVSDKGDKVAWQEDRIAFARRHVRVYIWMYVICILIYFIKWFLFSFYFLHRTMASFLLYHCIMGAIRRWNIDFPSSRYLVGLFAFVKTSLCPLSMCPFFATDSCLLFLMIPHKHIS